MSMRSRFRLINSCRGLRCAVVLLGRPAFRAGWTNSVQGALRLLPRRGPRARPGSRRVAGDVAGASARGAGKRSHALHGLEPYRRGAPRHRRIRHGQVLRAGPEHNSIATGHVPRDGRRLRRSVGWTALERVGRDHGEHALSGWCRWPDSPRPRCLVCGSNGPSVFRASSAPTRSPRLPAAAFSSAPRTAPSIRSALRQAASTGFFRPPRPCARPSASAASKQTPDHATPRSLATAPPISMPSMPQPGSGCGEGKWTISRSPG